MYGPGYIPYSIFFSKESLQALAKANVKFQTTSVRLMRSERVGAPTRAHALRMGP